jgi:aspartate/methionine/tyrosine aminotransferase
MTVKALLDLEPGADETLDALWLGYTESPGHPELRRAIASLYEEVPWDQVLVHAGGEEPIFNFMNVALAPGDHLVVHTPYYQSLGEVARGIGAAVSEWRGNSNLGWALDIGDLKNALTSRTKVVVVNFPHNPTGFLPDAGLMEEISRLSEQHGFIIFSDEVYRGLEIDPAHRLPTFADINQRAVSLGVMSKSFGLSGLRIGWIATQNRGLFTKLSAFKDYTTICNSAPSEFLATLAIRYKEKIIRRNLGIIRENLSRLDDFFDAHTGLFRWHRPKAGSIGFPLLIQGSADEFCRDLLKQKGVLLLPGSVYGPGYNGFRVGFGRRDFPDCLRQLDQYLGLAKK